MGMFDDVELEDGIELPDGYKGRQFQTKDFENVMDHLKITNDGRIMRLHYEMRDTGRVKWKEYEEWREFHWRDKPFHGTLRFYDYDNPRGITSKEFPFRPEDWHEYDAKFTDGKLEEIIHIPHPKTET